MDRSRCLEHSCELWSRGCSDPTEPCTLDDDGFVKVLIEVKIPMYVDDIYNTLEENNISTPEECGYAFDEVQWTMRQGANYPTWEVPTIEGQTKEVKGLGNE